MGNEDGDEAKSSAVSKATEVKPTMKDPVVAYEHAIFGLTQVRVGIAKFHDSVSPHAWINTNLLDVKLKESKLAKLEKELEFWKQNVILSCSVLKDAQNVLDKHLCVILECEDQLEFCHLQIMGNRDLCEQAARPPPSTAAPAVINSPTMDSEFKLEKIKPPTFSGQYSEWQSFSDLFRAAVIDNPKISGALKLVYLKGSLIGDAANIAASFPPTNLSFTEAWDLVEKRYNRKREIVFAHLQKLFSLSNAPDTAIGIRKLIDTINQCVRSLKLLEVDVDKWDVFLVYWGHLKIDSETRKQWLLQTGDDLPKLKEFLDYLEKRATALSIPSKGKGDTSKPSTSSHHGAVDAKTCLKCGESHGFYHCDKFRALSPNEKFTFAKEHRLCVKCLCGHPTKDCRRKVKCGKCNKPTHHTFLHFEGKGNTTKAGGPTNNADKVESGGPTRSSESVAEDNVSTTVPGTSGTVKSHHITSPISNDSVVLLATLIINVSDNFGELHSCRVFLDPGSEANFVSENLVDRLSLPRLKSCVTISGIGGTSGNISRGIVDFTAFSKDGTFSMPVKALILPKLTGYIPKEKCEMNFSHLEGLVLSDPNFHIPSLIDILLGAEAASQILLPGLRVGPVGTPTAQNSKFGWFLTGSAPSVPGQLSSCHVRVCHSTCRLEEQCLESSLRRFWELEEPTLNSSELSSEDNLCEQFVSQNMTRDSDGRFGVPLPFLPTAGVLGDSRLKAISCFKSLERQFQKDEKLKNSYFSQIQQYLDNNWIERVPPKEIFDELSVVSAAGESLTLSPYYIPHHVVVKPDNITTQYRIVFNASAPTTSGNSLNCLLLSGPKIQTDLHPLLVRFRSHQIALCADIVKFYHQVKVLQPYSNFQRFVYRKTPQDIFTDFRFLRVTFGVTSAPFLAIRALRQLGEESESEFPLASKCIKNDFLVDNLLTGGSTLEEVLETKSQIISVLQRGQFPLQKFASNNSEVVSSISPSESETFNLDTEEDAPIKTIGLFWHPSSDTFGVKICIPPFSASITKREILSHTAKIFDPLQWLAPVTITPKIILQHLWKEKVGWDDPIPAAILKRWRKFYLELGTLGQFRIPRCIALSPSDDGSTTFELIGFCDASNEAYAACVYLRSKCADKVKVELIGAKTKVAPISGETTPRLELCSAVLLCQLVNFVATSLKPTKIQISEVKCFTDSTGALGQIFSTEKQPVFVSNRVRKIRNSIILIHWFHVPGDDNPADCASRGISSSCLLTHPLWLNGPAFLLTDIVPPQPYEQTVSTFAVSATTGHEFFNEQLIALITRSSSFVQMKRLLGYWVRFVDNFKVKAGGGPTDFTQPSAGGPKITKTVSSGPTNTQTKPGGPNFFKWDSIPPLSSNEIERAKMALVKCVQNAKFKDDILRCQNEKTVKSDLRFLSPFLDTNGLLRVGGRLERSTLTYSNKHPMLLPKCHSKPSREEKPYSHFVTCVARHFHETNLHAGPKLLLALIRTEFWIPRGQQLCSQIFRHCVQCVKQHPRPLTQIMAPLPSARVTPDFPFVKVGIDYAGPFELALTPGRKPKLIQAYVCVFVCMSTKAVHLEYSGGLSTPDFTSALQRFCAIRNTPSHIYCDGGRNFFGSKNDMDALQKLLSDPGHLQRMSFFFTGEKINFHLNPPYGPHHGGIWEAVVKSMKLHLHRVIQGHHVSLEEFITLLARTSAALNSRPLSPLSNDPDDFEALTPFHFLTMRAPKFITEEDVTPLKCHKSRWQLVQQMSQHLFRRWSQDFLQTLQQKSKWLDPKANITKGALVLLHDAEATFGHRQWQIGRITEVFPGKDGRVRTCEVKVPIRNEKDEKPWKTKVYIRPITRLSPLPLDEEVTSAYGSLQVIE